MMRVDATGMDKTALGRMMRLIPPEGVPITFRIASLGARCGAQMLDLILTYLGTFLILLLALWLKLLSLWALEAMFFLLTFLIRIPYYTLSELVWNGRTLGKRIAGIRVISLDGGRLAPQQIVARNLMKEAEVFLPLSYLFGLRGLGWVEASFLGVWMLAVLAVPFVNRRNQRLGDMLAGTIVVDSPRASLLPDLAQRPALAASYMFSAAQLDVYGRYELQVLEEVLRTKPATLAAKRNLADIAAAVVKRLALDHPVPEAQTWDFLNAFYRQQRAYLESRNLFGDLRVDKFHRTAGRKPGGRPGSSA